MIPSVYISIFGLGLSTVTDLKNAITAKLAQNFQVNWTHIADKKGEFKHEVRQFEKSYDNQQAEQISLMV